jgi:hypothetical protein
MIQLGANAYGMIAGDGDGNGLIQAHDMGTMWYQRNGLLGYYGGDSNLDTSVDSWDRNTYIAPNYGIIAPLPEPPMPLWQP